MKAFVMLLLAIPLAGCQTNRSQPLAYSGGNGSSCEQAVIINGAKYRETGLLGQRLWLEQKYPGYRQTGDSLQTADNKQINLVQVRTADGQTRTVYFDVTDSWRR